MIAPRTIVVCISEPASEALATTPAEDLSARFLATLTASGKHVYAGTVPAHVKARRRAKGRVAKRSRKANR